MSRRTFSEFHINKPCPRDIDANIAQSKVLVVRLGALKEGDEGGRDILQRGRVDVHDDEHSAGFEDAHRLGQEGARRVVGQLVEDELDGDDVEAALDVCCGRDGLAQAVDVAHIRAAVHGDGEHLCAGVEADDGCVGPAVFQRS